MTRGIVGQQECSVKQQRGKLDDCIINSVHRIVIILDFFLIRKIYCDPNICSYVLQLGLLK